MTPLMLVFLLLILIVSLGTLAWNFVGGPHGHAAGALSAPRLVIVRAARDLAWEHRDIEPTLADALLEKVRAIEAAGRASTGDLDDLLETAWTHRETDPLLSDRVVALIREERKAIEG